jgi:hypothetical protein
MAYGLRYTITQKLRDDLNQVVKIYEEDYVGATVTTYEATNVNIQPNSNEEDPIGGIISSQLDVSFLISTEEDYDNFPELLNYNDNKYYVELVIDNNIKWKGFLFNDYINVQFTTGNQEVSITCIDGLSFLKYIYYDSEVSINDLITLLNIIGQGLNKIVYPNMTFIYACCSYYASSMFDRSDAGGDEPFKQAYQYRRDLLNLDYFTILDNIVKGFGCRLFQANGDWYILPMNQMATTIYYTRYVVADVPSNSGNGILDNLIEIEPYAEGNVHFVNNGQTKIVRKGYPTIITNVPYTYASNYIHNPDLKQIDGAGFPIGWEKTQTGTGVVQFFQFPDSQFNVFSLIVTSGSGTASVSMGNSASFAYLPKMYGLEASLSFDFRGSMKVFIEIFIYNGTGYTSYYLKNDGTWTTVSSSIDAVSTTGTSYDSKTIKIPLGEQNTSSGKIVVEGYVNCSFFVQNNSASVKNFQLTQSAGDLKQVIITRSINENQIIKNIDLKYGLIYPDLFVYINDNYINRLSDVNGNILTGWYRYGHSAESFDNLPQLIMRQYSNLLNRNIATLEGDLGNYTSSVGMIYLDKVYEVQDASTNALSYNGKKFLINRLTTNPYNSEVNSIQLIEVIDEDNASTETIQYDGYVSDRVPRPS